MSAAVTHRIGDLCEQIRGVTYSKADAVLSPRAGFKPVLRANNITERGLTFEDLVYVPAGRIAAKQFVRQNDVVVAASSGSIDVVGKAARAPGNFDGGFGAFCKVLRPNGKVDPGYFAHFFQTQGYRRRVSALAAGANINNLRNEHLDDLEVALPPLPEQRRIAAILDKADALRAKRREAIAKLDQLLRSMFLDMFGNPCQGGDKDWRRVPILQLCGVTYGFPFDSSCFGPTGQWKVVRIRDVMRGDTQTFYSGSESFEARHWVENGQLLVGMDGNFNAARWRGGRALMNQRVCRFEPVAGAIDDEFFFACLPYFLKKFEDETPAVTVKHLSAKQIRSILIPLPPEELQLRYGNAARLLSRLRFTSEIALQEAEALFRSIQGRAFAGAL